MNTTREDLARLRELVDLSETERYYRYDAALARVAAELERLERENAVMDTSIAEYAEASGVLVHSWPDDERERQRQTLYSDTKWMQGALDAQAETIERQREENERLRGVHLAASGSPWSFHRGSLRERIEWCRIQHHIAAENPPLEPPSREAKADFDRACVGWYEEMLAQVDEAERELARLRDELRDYEALLDGTLSLRGARRRRHDRRALLSASQDAEETA